MARMGGSGLHPGHVSVLPQGGGCSISNVQPARTARTSRMDRVDGHAAASVILESVVAEKRTPPVLSRSEAGEKRASISLATGAHVMVAVRSGSLSG